MHTVKFTKHNSCRPEQHVATFTTPIVYLDFGYWNEHILTSSLTRGIGLLLQRSGMLSIPNGTFPLHTCVHTTNFCQIWMYNNTIKKNPCMLELTDWPWLSPWLLNGAPILISVLKCRAHLVIWRVRLYSALHANISIRERSERKMGWLSFSTVCQSLSNQTSHVLSLHKCSSTHRANHSPSQHTVKRTKNLMCSCEGHAVTLIWIS